MLAFPFFLSEDQDIWGLNEISSFELSSCWRARQAIAFGLKMRSADAACFVVGDDPESGRMTSTLELS